MGRRQPSTLNFFPTTPQPLNRLTFFQQKITKKTNVKVFVAFASFCLICPETSLSQFTRRGEWRVASGEWRVASGGRTLSELDSLPRCGGDCLSHLLSPLFI